MRVQLRSLEIMRRSVLRSRMQVAPFTFLLHLEEWNGTTVSEGYASFLVLTNASSRRQHYAEYCNWKLNNLHSS